MDKVDEILNANFPKQLKIVRLYALTQLNYQQPLGDKALDGINSLTDSETTEALVFLCGWSTGDTSSDKWRALLG